MRATGRTQARPSRRFFTMLQPSLYPNHRHNRRDQPPSSWVLVRLSTMGQSFAAHVAKRGRKSTPAIAQECSAAGKFSVVDGSRQSVSAQ